MKTIPPTASPLTDPAALALLKQRAAAALAARRLVDSLPSSIADRTPLRLSEMKRPLWTRLTRRRVDPFKLTEAKVASWMQEIADTHPPLLIEAERPSSERTLRRDAERNPKVA